MKPARLHINQDPHKNGLVTLAPKIIGSTSQDLVPALASRGSRRFAGNRVLFSICNIFNINNIFNETEVIEFMEHVLAF